MRVEELKDELRLCRNVVYIYRLVSNLYIKERRISEVHHWSWLAKVLGIKSRVIVSEAEHKNTWSAFARWRIRLPFRMSRVLVGHIIVQGYVPSLPRLMLRAQKLISYNSEVIKACQTHDILKIQEILKAKEVHPNDRTPDDLTVFRVSLSNN